MRDDRLRCETRGMADSAGKTIEMLNGETWHFHWQFYAPASLKGTSRFTHIMQMKYVDKGGGASGSPIVTLTLRSGDNVELLLWLGGGSVATTSMAGLHDKWLSADLTMKIAPQGNVHWTFKDGDKVLVDKQQNGTIWPGDAARIRPKWGIYRGITTGVQTTYIQLAELRAYRCK
jgi:chitin-binding protein